ncbi:MAG TPA: thiamine-phosphate kinase [Candidatus Acidoferrum sp.]|jgi:thiamine-monophosphate kinase
MTRPVDEKDLLRKIIRAFPSAGKNAPGMPLDDDAAVFSPRVGYQTILTCDWMLEGSHFLRHKHPADAVGWKCLMRATSDIAAMGGVPRYFLLSLAIPQSLSGRWLPEFFRGLQRATIALNCKLAGGDTTRRNDILISVTVIGEIANGLAIRRSGAKPGDQLFVTGTLGEAELGLKMLRHQRGFARPKNPPLRKHLYPEPRLAVGQWLARNRLASAMMDLSDGLSSDLPRLCEASGVGTKIVTEQLPVSSLVVGQEALSLALHGGDDYELLFAVRPKKANKIPREYNGISLTHVGEITPGKKIQLEKRSKVSSLTAGGWDPFRK